MHIRHPQYSNILRHGHGALAVQRLIHVTSKIRLKQIGFEAVVFIKTQVATYLLGQTCSARPDRDICDDAKGGPLARSKEP